LLQKPVSVKGLSDKELAKYISKANTTTTMQDNSTDNDAHSHLSTLFGDNSK